LYCEDCLVSLSRLKEEGIKVDLIYLDPPFSTNRSYYFIFRDGKDRVLHKVLNDTFGNKNVNQLLLDFDHLFESDCIDESVRIFLKAWIEPLKQQNRPKDRKLISYLVYMAQRLVAMRDVLSDTGSIYYHCDPTASHYIKIIMDGVFGRAHFRNEIIWHYDKFLSSKKKVYNRANDIIFFYSKTNKCYFNYPFEERETTHSKRGYVPQSFVKE